ncbi:MAG: hypothetical protein AAF985_24480 [Bacteroidota bacterium]
MKWTILIIHCLLMACAQTGLGQKVTVKTDEPHLLQAEEVQLSPPQLLIDSLFFYQSTQLKMALNLRGSNLYYSLNDGPEQRYFKAILMEKSSHLRMQARKPGFQASDWLELRTVKVNDKFRKAKVRLSREASEQYPGQGVASLIDLKKGGLDFRAESAWLGFQTTELVIQVELEEMTAGEQLFLSFLSDHNAWIFLPQKVEIWHGDQQIGHQILDHPSESTRAHSLILPIPLTKGNYQQLDIKIVALAQIPDWHPGKGQLPWLFIDEILIN